MCIRDSIYVGLGGTGVDFGQRVGLVSQYNVQVSYINLVGPMSNGTAACTGVTNCGYGIRGADGQSSASQNYNTYIGHVTINGIAEAIDADRWNNSVIEYSSFSNLLTGGQHPDVVYSGGAHNFVFRYNYVTNCQSECIFTDNYNDFSGWYIYGNSFVQGPLGGAYWLEIGETDVHIYNNNFIGITSNAALKLNVLAAPSEVYNNMFFNSGVGDLGGTNGVLASTSNNISTAVDPFVNTAGGDFHLKAGSIAINAGKVPPSDAFETIDSNAKTDPDGYIYGSTGTWDVGAYEYH